MVESSLRLRKHRASLTAILIPRVCSLISIFPSEVKDHFVHHPSLFSLVREESPIVAETRAMEASGTRLGMM